MPTFLTPLLHGSAAHFTLQNVRNGATLAESLLPAFDSASRRTGLLGRDHLPVGSAMIIAPSSAIHTWFMRFPIDVAFVTKTGLIVKIRRDLGPWRMAIAWGAHAVVEFPAGTLARSATGEGDRLVLVQR